MTQKSCSVQLHWGPMDTAVQRQDVRDLSVPSGALGFDCRGTLSLKESPYVSTVPKGFHVAKAWSCLWFSFLFPTSRVLLRECTGHSKHPLPTTQEKTLHMDITQCPTPKSDWIFFAAKDGEALYSQQKQDWELTVTQIMNSLLPNSDLNWRK